MANGVNVKMGVSGLSQFKNNISQAKSSVKTLEAQLALNEKQFKATGDAESYMTERSELLKAKMEQQKKIIATTEEALKNMADKGVDRSSKAYQDMYRQMVNAKGDLIDTESQLNGVAEASYVAASGVESMNSQLNSINSQVSFKTVTDGIDKITGGLENAAKRAIQLGKAIVRGSMDAAQYADEILTRSSRYGDGYDAELVQKMDNVAAYIDTETDTIINAQKKLRKAMGSDKNADLFSALGIDPSNGNWEDAFWKAGEAIKALDDDIKREEYATQLFGKSWDALNPLFDAGRQKYEQMLSEQTVLTNDQIAALGKEDDAMKKMQQQIDLLKKQFWAGLAPAITVATNALSGLVEQFNIYLQSEDGQEMLKKMGDAVSGLFEDLSKIDPQEVISGFSGVFKTITDGFQWIYTHKEGIVKALEGIVLGWGALKLTGGALKVAEFLTGIKGLKGGAAAAAGEAAGMSWGASFASGIAKAIPWLAGLGILFENAIKPQGNDDLVDENGELTELGQAAVDTLPVAGRKYSVAEEAAIQDLWDKYRSGNFGQSDLDALSGLILNDQKFAELMASLYDMTQTHDWQNLTDLPEDFFLDNANTSGIAQLPQAIEELKGMPGEVAEAVVGSMSNMGVYMDGEKVGQLVAPAVGASFAGVILAVTK